MEKVAGLATIHRADAEAWRKCGATLSHKAYALRYGAFRAELAPVLFKALESGDAKWAGAVRRAVRSKEKTMDSMKKAATVLDDIRIHVKMKLSALWVSVMLCYIYGDYFGLYEPGKLQGMLEGKMGPLGPTTQGVLLGTAILLRIT